MSERRRWQPPPMKDGAGSDSGDPSVRLDEKVVRKMLQVNPTMRAGRTTSQVKHDMEGGQAVPTDGSAPIHAKKPSAVDSTRGGTGSSKSELDDTLGFFIRGKSDKLTQALTDIAARKKIIELEEAQTKKAMAHDLAKFIAMLDEQIVAMHAVSALSKHKGFLSSLELTPAQVLELARKARS